MSPDTLEIYKQMSFLSSVIAGFAITAAIQLVTQGDQKKERRPLLVITLTVFLTCSALLTAATFIFIIVLGSVLGSPGFPSLERDWLVRFEGGIAVMPFAGLLLFLAGIGLVGWLHSRLLGALTTAAALTAAGMALAILISMGASG